MNGRNERQGGWIVTFVAVGGLLVLGLVAGLYYFKTNVDQSATEQIASGEQTADQSSDEEPAVAPADEDDAKTDNAPVDADSSDTASPATEEPDTVTNEEDADTDAGSVAANSDGDSGTSTDALPQTGPSENFATAGLVALVVFALVAYVRSREAAQATL